MSGMEKNHNDLTATEMELCPTPQVAVDRLTVLVRRQPGTPPTVGVHVTYRCPTDLPLVGGLVPDVDLAADAVMAQEG